MADSNILQRIALKAIIINDEGEVLVLREAKTYNEGTRGGRFQIPGGRLEPGELWSDGLSREVFEETGLKVEIIRPYFVSEWRPVIKGHTNQIIGIFMLCRLVSSEITLSNEHDSFEWINKNNYGQFDIVDNEFEMLRNYFNEDV